MNEPLSPRPLRIRPLIAEAPDTIRRCPKCQSVFVSDFECETCGYHLDFDPYGAPMGPKSFYALREQHITSRPLKGLNNELLAHFYPDWKRQYQRNLIHRYRLLVEYFVSDQKDQRRKYFLIELKDMITELVHYDVDSEVIWKPLDELAERDDQILLLIVREAIKDGQLAIEQRRQNSWLTRKWWGLLSTGTLVRIGLLLTASVAMSLGIFRYLTL